MRNLKIGDQVLYVLEDGPSEGEVRPAVVVRLWSDFTKSDNPFVQLQVFTDGLNDGNQYAGGIAWKTSRQYFEDKKPGTWHFPE
jgi:hypothetical protein